MSPTPVAIDKAALILHGRALEIYMLWKHPHVAALQEAMRGVPAAERKATLERANDMIAYFQEVKTAIEKLEEAPTAKTAKG
jgi:hypothetical protein